MYKEIYSGAPTTDARDLLSFLQSRYESEAVVQLVKSNSEKVEKIYRGIQYLASDLKVGHVYEHWNTLSSWTFNQDVARGFATDGYIPEDLLEEVIDDMKDTSMAQTVTEIEDSALSKFKHVILELVSDEGFVVSNHLENNPFLKEEEVILYMGSWVIKDISISKDDDIEIVYVTLEKH